MAIMNDKEITLVCKALDQFQIETPSWGFADSGTRFGTFLQDAAAVDIEDKFSDAGMVHRLMGCCPTVAVHVLWDFKPGQPLAEVTALAKKHQITIGAINPNLFQEQHYKYGSFGNPCPEARKKAIQHVLDSIEIGKQVKSKNVSLWFADGSNYPGQANIRQRKRYFEECLAQAHKCLAPDQTMLIEYKPFEPAFYHTDIADWGMSYVLSKKAGPQAKVLVDTGHHYQSQNIEQIVAWLLDENMLGGFHFNDRHYADDDLTMGSIHPYAVFRIFYEIHSYMAETGRKADIAYMIDQSHIDKPKVQATIQTVLMAQMLYAKAALVDYKTLRSYQAKNQQMEAEEMLQAAFFKDVTPALHAWRKQRNLPLDPMKTYRESGYEERVAKERKQKRLKK